MHFFARGSRQTGVVDLEAEVCQIVGDLDRVGLLLVNTKRERLDTAKEKERVERRQGVTDRVDRKCDTLLTNSNESYVGHSR